MLIGRREGVQDTGEAQTPHVHSPEERVQSQPVPIGCELRS